MTDCIPHAVVLIILVGAAYPFWRGWRALKRTSLRDAFLWTVGAWFGWMLASAVALAGGPAAPFRYLAAALNGCALVAVLGARRPGVTAWSFVLAGLLAVFLLPLLEQKWNSPNWQLDAPRTMFLGVVLAVGVINYLPTRFGWLAAALGIASALQVWGFADPEWRQEHAGLTYLLDATPALLAWGAAWMVRRPVNDSLDALWLSFRDRYGLVWGLRVQEQFNHAARHAGWPARLRWFGLEVEPGTPTEDLRRILQGLRQRFENENQAAASE